MKASKWPQNSKLNVKSSNFSAASKSICDSVLWGSVLCVSTLWVSVLCVSTLWVSVLCVSVLGVLEIFGSVICGSGVLARFLF